MTANPFRITHDTSNLHLDNYSFPFVPTHSGTESPPRLAQLHHRSRAAQLGAVLPN